MNIAILGTRGIPNNYGGFEQCAEKLSRLFAEKGHKVSVYNPSEHEYLGDKLNGAIIKRIFSNEKTFGFLNAFIFDYLCLKDALESGYDIILELGYHPAALFYYLKKNKKTRLLTNTAGMEWKRSKWNYITKKLIRYCEKLSVKKSDAIISDNPGISNYFKNEYEKDSFYIAYGADLFEYPKSLYLDKYEIRKYAYDVLIARFQKDNNLEMIINGHNISGSNVPLLVIGGNDNSYGSFIKEKYKSKKNIKFVGGIYDYNELSTIRWYSRLYFHGHSCGGTNPSLLEAMASNAYIVAYDISFNRYVLEDGGLYFINSKILAEIIRCFNMKERYRYIKKNRDRIMNEYQWENIADKYLEAFKTVIKNGDL